MHDRMRPNYNTHSYSSGKDNDFDRCEILPPNSEEVFGYDNCGYHASEVPDCLKNTVWALLSGGFFAFYNLIGGLLCMVTIVGFPFGWELIRGIPYVCCPFGTKFKTNQDHFFPFHNDEQVLGCTSRWFAVAYAALMFPAIFLAMPFLVAYPFLYCGLPCCFEIGRAGVARVLCVAEGNVNDQRVWYLGRRGTTQDSTPKTNSHEISEVRIEMPSHRQEAQDTPVIPPPPKNPKILNPKQESTEDVSSSSEASLKRVMVMRLNGLTAKQMECPETLSELITQGGKLLDIPAFAARNDKKKPITDICRVANNRIVYITTEVEESELRQ